MFSKFGVSSEKRTDERTDELNEVPEPVRTRALSDEDADFLLRVRGTNVLLVEDSADFRAYVTRMIELSGGRVDCAENGLEGIKAALANHYDIILMDIMMPRLDGFEATRKLREWGYKGSIVALTGTEPTSLRETCHEAGFDELLLKPVHRVRLLYTIACRPRYHEPEEPTGTVQ